MIRFPNITPADRAKMSAAELECVTLYCDELDPMRVTDIARARGTTPQNVSILLRRAHRKIMGKLGASRPVSLDSIDESQVVACA